MNPQDAALNFFLTAKIPTQEGTFYSSNRGEANARLSNILTFTIKTGFSTDSASLIIASVGEITNNCFDHNSGFWTDVPGCVVSLSVTGGVFTIGIADRGRGIVNSLAEAIPEEKDKAQIMKAAFERVISGRSPEKRGNGLKFVRKNIEASLTNALICFSNEYTYRVGHVVSPAPQAHPQGAPFGTLTYLQWKIK